MGASKLMVKVVGPNTVQILAVDDVTGGEPVALTHYCAGERELLENLNELKRQIDVAERSALTALRTSSRRLVNGQNPGQGFPWSTFAECGDEEAEA